MMRSIVLVFALATAACGTHYAFVPVSPPARVVPAFNRDAAYMAIPENDPHGDLRVLSYGIEKLTSGDPDEPSADDDIATLHLRVVVENTGSKPWTFDTRDQRLDADGFGAESPAFVVSDRDGDGSVPPVINLRFGERRIVDLFYPAPPGVDAMPAFRAITTVHTDEGDAVETTPFRRIEVGILSPYMQNDILGDDDYDYLDEPFWNNAGGVTFRGGVHPWRGAVQSRGSSWAGLPSRSSRSSSSSSSSRGGHARSGGGRGRMRSGGGGGHHSSSGGGRRR